MKKKSKKLSEERHIKQGGMRTQQGERMPDIVLQMPEIFLFDMNAYMNAVTQAKSIDCSCRTRLYDMYESAMLDLHLSGVLDNVSGASHGCRYSSCATACLTRQ